MPADKIKNGNAVIAVTRGGTVVWSWHLWFAPADVLGTVTCTNFQNHVYKFTNETLGWKYTAWVGSPFLSTRNVKVKVEQEMPNGGTKQEAVFTITQEPGFGAKEGSATFYQWGRKDAFPGRDTTPPDGSFIQNGGNNMSIQNGIQHPESFYTNGPAWYTPPTGCSYNNLWSMDNTVTDFNDNAVVKTIYDPCPAGFRMPTSNAFTGFATTGDYGGGGVRNIVGGWSLGYNFNNRLTSPDATVYFPPSGYRSYTNGSVVNPSFDGCYWTATPRYSNSVLTMSFDPFTVNPRGASDRSFGHSIRPVLDE